MKYLCPYVTDWRCWVKGKEKPIQVCKICIEAKRVSTLEKKSERKVRGIPIEEGQPRDEKEILTETKKEIPTEPDKEIPVEKEKGRGTVEKEAETLERLEKDSIYLFESEDRESFFQILNGQGSKISCVTTTHPQELMEEYDIELEDSLWVSSENDPVAVSPDNLDDIILEIKIFLSQDIDFILIDALDEIFSSNHDPRIIEALNTIEENIENSGCTIIFYAPPSSISKKNLARLKEKLEIKEVPTIAV